MVSATTFTATQTFNAVPCPAPTSPPTASASVVEGKPNTAFAFENVSINGVAPANVEELLDLGKTRHNPASITATAAAKRAFSEKDFDFNDVEYFKALLAARSEIRLALENKIEGLRSLRKRNNRLAKRKARKNKKARAATAASAEAGVMETLRKTASSDDKSVSTRSGLTLSISTGSVGCDPVVRVSDRWHGHRGGDVHICSSPVSMDEEIGGRCGQEPQQSGAMGNAAMMKNGLSYSA